MLVLSLFPGIGLLDRGFERAGFCVVRGPDLIWGGDIRNFEPPAAHFDGIIGGSPCQDFSRARRDAPTGYGVAMLSQFERCVLRARPAWWLLENVDLVPDLRIAGYSWQRLDVWAHEFGISQRRLRHIQFGSCDGTSLVLPRGGSGGSTPTITASDDQTPLRHFLTAQGLPPDFDIPPFTRAALRRAVGNGVPLAMAQALGQAVRDRQPSKSVRLCGCGCGRPVAGQATYARGACRMRMHRRRVTKPGVTAPAA